MAKEDNAIVLEYLPHGYPLSKQMRPVVQAVGFENLTLLELIPRRGATFEFGEKVYIGEGKRDKVYYILGKLKSDKLTEAAKTQLQEIVAEKIKKNEQKLIEFFNRSTAINKRMHQIELLPGLGKKHMQEILKVREEKLFESFEDLKSRVPNLPNPEKVLERRIFKEITGQERYNLFV